MPRDLAFARLQRGRAPAICTAPEDLEAFQMYQASSFALKWPRWFGGGGSNFNDRRGKPQVLVPMFPLTRACPIVEFRFFETRPDVSVSWELGLPRASSSSSSSFSVCLCFEGTLCLRFEWETKRNTTACQFYARSLPLLAWNL